MNFIVREPSLNEINLVREFFLENLSRNFPIFPANAREAYATSWTPEMLEKRIKNNHGLLLTAWQDNELSALISGTDSEGGVATIIWLFVKPDKFNQGLGSALFNSACENYRKRKCHKLKLTAPTEEAKNFYLKLGMKEEGFHAKHWWGLDFWALSKFL